MQIKSWKNKRILVTGSQGFIGSHLLQYFESKHAITLGVSRKTRSAKGRVALDVTNFNALLAVVKKFKPDAFFHLASDALVEAGQLDPYSTFYNNIVGSLNVLEVCRIRKISRVIIASTVHVYGNAPLPYVENEPARPSRPYETSKTSIDLLAQSYADTYGVPVLIPRFVNIYGPGDLHTTRIIPKTIQSLLRGRMPTLWGGITKRDYLYIDDAIKAYDLLGKISDSQIEKNRIFNFATGREVSAKNIIQDIITMMGKNVSIKKIHDTRTNELKRQSVNWSKAKKVLGWRPSVTLSEGLSKTISWYQAHASSL